MPRAPASPSGPKLKKSVSIDRDLLRWVGSRTGPGREFSSLSHAVERGLAMLRDREGKKAAPGRR